MKVEVYTIEDPDVLEVYFGEQAIPRPIAGLGTTHGERLFSGHLDLLPVEGDVVKYGTKEYILVYRLFDIESNTAELVVTSREFEIESS